MKFSELMQLGPRLKYDQDEGNASSPPSNDELSKSSSESRNHAEKSDFSEKKKQKATQMHHRS